MGHPLVGHGIEPHGFERVRGAGAWSLGEGRPRPGRFTETYPKVQQQLGKVVGLRERINRCLINPLEGGALGPNDPRMVAMEAYLAWDRRGVALEPGKQ
jgi:hypothetical protein